VLAAATESTKKDLRKWKKKRVIRRSQLHKLVYEPSIVKFGEGGVKGFSKFVDFKKFVWNVEITINVLNARFNIVLCDTKIEEMATNHSELDYGGHYL